MNTTRTPRPNVTRISTSTQWIELAPGQQFYSTPKAYELWQLEPLALVKRWDKKRIYWVVEGDA